MKSELTDTDYEALFAVMQADMPRIWREIFPKILAQLEATGVLTITVTDTEVVVSSAKPPQTAVYRGAADETSLTAAFRENQSAPRRTETGQRTFAPNNDQLGRFALANCIASRPAMRPKVIVSEIELPPRRFAPCTPPVTSPAA